MPATAKRGRPSGFTPAIGQSICDRVSTSTIGTRALVKEFDISLETLFTWRAKHKDFNEQYALAKEAQAAIQAEELNQLAESVEDKVLSCDPKLANALVQAIRLEIDTKKWTAAKLLPKKYGDKVQQEHTGSVGVQLIHSIPRPERDK